MLNLSRGNNGNTQNPGAGVSAGAISLQKGQRVDLTKGNPSLDKIHVGLGWDVNEFHGAAFDLDASVFLVGKSGKIEDQKNFIFFNNLQSPNGAVKHTGDNLTGEGDGDDESIKVQLSAVPADVDKIIFTVSIYEAGRRSQNFGMVSNAFIRIVDEATGQEKLRFDLTEDFSMEQSVVVGELYRHGAEWKFNAVGRGIAGEIDQLVAMYM